MDTQTEANPAAEQEAIAPAAEGATPEHTTETIDDGSDLPEIDTGEMIANPEDDLEEVDWEDGQKYRVPKALKPALMKEADYRKKTMELAEIRKAAEAEREQAQRAAQLSQAEFQAAVDLKTLSDQVEQYEQVDWDAWTDADPFEAQKAWQKYQTVLNKRNTLGAQYQHHMQQKAQQAQQETAKRREAILSTVANEIPNWSSDLQNQIESFAEANGYSREELAGGAEPRDYKILRLAHIGQQFLDRQKAAAKMKAASQAKAAPTVSGNAPGGNTDANSMSAEEYIEARRAGRI